MAEAFCETYKGNLATQLGDAVAAMREIDKLSSQLFAVLYFFKSQNTSDQNVQRAMGQISEAFATLTANYLQFFEHEVAKLNQADYDRQVAAHPVAKHHKPMLDRIRKEAKYMLDEPIERALSLRSPFGPSEWDEYFDEVEASLRFNFGGKKLTIIEILNILSEDRDPAVRRRALKSLNKELGKGLAPVMARAYNVTMGKKLVEDRERGYAHPMAARNIGNMVSDEVVDALHKAVSTEGAALAQRYYKLMAKWLGKKKLSWADRNAKVPLADDRLIPWDECKKTVIAAYSAFSPTLGKLVAEQLNSTRVDAPSYPGKESGAYNYSIETTKGVRSYTLLNYNGSARDVATTAHELGHGVHGLLAGAAQGAMMMQAPMAYAETASIFGEMLTFNYQMSQAKNDREKLALLGKMSDFLNSVCRQISFSNFEQKCFAARAEGKLTVEQFNQIWADVTTEMYGAEGDVFTYGDTDHLWCYVSHFLRPFYVYAYAFGELLTQSLYAYKDQVPNFEEKYLDLLRAGGTKDAVELLKPFGLDPTDPNFWVQGIRASMGQWMDEAEKLSADLGYKP